MKITFNANMSGGMGYTMEDNSHLSIETTEDGNVTLTYTPAKSYTTQYAVTDLMPESVTLSTDLESTLCDCGNYTCTSTSACCGRPEENTDETSEDEPTEFIVDFVDDEEENEVLDEEENCGEDEDINYAIAKKISEFDKDGTFASIVTSLLDSTNEASAKAAKTISKMMANLVKEMDEYKGKLV